MSTKKPTSTKKRSALAAGVAIVALALPLGAISAAAAGSQGANVVAARRGHHAYAMQHWRESTWRRPPIYGYAGIPPGVIAEPGGYLYWPGHGILGEACNLPTSACPNSERDIQ
jgi:hypothetical protein